MKAQNQLAVGSWQLLGKNIYEMGLVIVMLLDTIHGSHSLGDGLKIIAGMGIALFG